jgi:uncharacterized protein (DUF488 family)
VLFTVGHGRLDRPQLAELLTGAGVHALVDVRRSPGSRTNQDARKEELSRWLPDLGIDYRWEQRLGGRRRLPAGEPSLDPWWTVPAFRAYAAHTRTLEFTATLDDVMAQATSGRVAIMCAESLWWRCHRRLIADVVMLTRSRSVRHLIPRPATRARAERAELSALLRRHDDRDADPIRHIVDRHGAA